ncbi:hypothetical protein [Teichococcus oryzae]|uniref:Uncharacterized protein n=1 Tax=Teichococcus oryzae TaxID=1608942 RepID=A0A5B2TB73_9PROT|nr:hypothetical protein [Pseudoroseomonas oryzae]KAA2211333.1 hypothetical protein F0Q34_20685 [Pseudoroseomonas oryzae]
MTKSDADLIAACSRFFVLEEEQDRLMGLVIAASAHGDTQAENALLAQLEAGFPVYQNLVDNIMKYSSLTVAGLRMKARVAISLTQWGIGGEARSEEHQIICSLASDIINLIEDH